jgi:hypothetical protein
VEGISDKRLASLRTLKRFARHLQIDGRPFKHSRHAATSWLSFRGSFSAAWKVDHFTSGLVIDIADISWSSCPGAHCTRALAHQESTRSQNTKYAMVVRPWLFVSAFFTAA